MLPKMRREMSIAVLMNSSIDHLRRHATGGNCRFALHLLHLTVPKVGTQPRLPLVIVSAGQRLAAYLRPLPYLQASILPLLTWIVLRVDGVDAERPQSHRVG
jgi:hypothetical protein